MNINEFITKWGEELNAISEKNFRRYPMSDTMRRLENKSNFELAVKQMVRELIELLKKEK